MKTFWLPTLALIAVPASAIAQQSPDPSQTTAPQPAAPWGAPPAAGSTASPPSASSPSQTQQAPQPAPQQPAAQQPDAQSSYGQPAYGQPTYGQPSYAQPSYGQPSYGQAAYGAGYGPSPYGQPYYGPTYPASALPQRRVVEYRGGPIPPGATLETQRPTGLLIAGGVGFGAMYLLSVLNAASGSGFVSCGTASGCDYLYVPIVGPFITMGTGSFSGGDMFLLGLDGVVQAGGVALFVIGMVAGRQVLVFNGTAQRNSSSHRIAQNRPRWSLFPSAAGATAGATLTIAGF
jgi:hypothetical protein